MTATKEQCFAYNLAQLIRTNGHSVSQVARAMGFAKGTIRNHMKMKGNPNAATRERYCDLFNVTMDYFDKQPPEGWWVGRRGYPLPPGETEWYLETPEIDALHTKRLERQWAAERKFKINTLKKALQEAERQVAFAAINGTEN